MDQNYVLLRMKELLRQRNWSLYKLAREADIPYSSLNSLFQKNNYPTITTVEKICAGFHISMSQFFADSISDLPCYDFSKEEIDLILKVRRLNTHDRRLLNVLLDGMQKEEG